VRTDDRPDATRRPTTQFRIPLPHLGRPTSHFFAPPGRTRAGPRPATPSRERQRAGPTAPREVTDSLGPQCRKSIHMRKNEKGRFFFIDPVERGWYNDPLHADFYGRNRTFTPPVAPGGNGLPVRPGAPTCWRADLFPPGTPGHLATSVNEEQCRSWHGRVRRCPCPVALAHGPRAGSEVTAVGPRPSFVELPARERLAPVRDTPD
jgi:hypothetical protein